MKVSISISNLAQQSLEEAKKITGTVTAGLAKLVEGELVLDSPPRVLPHSMKYKSVRQRRFVMANIANGNITIPYRRGKGNAISPSETLNRSYRIDLQGTNAILVSKASYAQYVVGAKQADIHKGRWKSAIEVTQKFQEDGTVDKLVEDAVKGITK